MSNKQTLKQRANLYEIPYKIMQLEKDIQEKLKEVRSMRLRLIKLKQEELLVNDKH